MEQRGKKKKSIAEQVEESIRQASKQYQRSSTTSGDIDWSGLGRAVSEGNIRNQALKAEKKVLEAMGLEQSNNSIVRKILEKMPKGAVLDSKENMEIAKKLTDERLRATANGVNPDNVTDDRSALGKWLNLPKNQAWYWDIAEIAFERPSNALQAVFGEDHKFDKELEKFDPETHNKILQSRIGSRNAITPEDLKRSENAKAWLRANSDRVARYDEKKKSQDMDLGTAVYNALAGKSGTDMIQLARENRQALEKAREQKVQESSVMDYVGGLGAEILIDPMNAVPGAVLSSAIKGTGKGVKKVADVTRLTKAGKAIADSSPIRKVRDAFDYNFRSGGRTRDIEDNIIKGEDTILEKSQDARAFKDSTLQNLEDAYVASGKLAGGLDKGVEVGKIAEFPILQKQIDEAEGIIQKGYDDAQAIQTTVKSVDGTYKGVPMEDIARVTLKDLAPEAMRKVNIVEKSPYYTRFFDDIDMTKELIKKKANMDKQLGKHYKELYKALQSANSIQKMEKAVADILSNPQMADAKEALYEVLGFYEDVKPLVDDPKLAQSAKVLQEASAPIVKFAQDLGLPVKEVEGYMPRIWTDWGKEKFGGNLGSGIKAVNSPATVNNSKVATLNNRTFEADKTIQQINTKYKNKVFEDDAYKAFKHIEKRVDALATFKFIKETFSDPRFARQADEAEELLGTEKLGKSAVKMKVADITKHLSDDMKEAFEKSGIMQGDYYISKGLAQELEKFFQVLTPKKLNDLHQWWRKAVGVWKSLAVFSSQYHINNAVGAGINMYVKNMPLGDITSYVSKAGKVAYNYNKAITKGFINLTKAEKEAVELTKRFREAGLSKSSHHSQTAFKQDDFLETVSKRVEGKIKKNPLKLNHAVAETSDDITRMAYFNWLKDAGKSTKEARSLVRQTLYDARDLTLFEQNLNADWIMFYSWMRKNIPFMLRQMGEHPKKFYQINKTLELSSQASGQDRDLLPDYYQGALSLPYNLMFAPALPVQDLSKVSDTQSAIETLVGMGNPAIKFLMERASGREFFNNQPITNKTEHFLSTAFPPLNRLLDGIKKAEKEKGTINPLDILLSLTGNPIKEYDPEKFTKYQMQDDLNKVKDAIKEKIPNQENRVSLEDLSSLGLVSKNQKSEDQYKASIKLMEDAVKLGLDPQVAQMLPHLKQQAMQSTQEELGSIVEVLRKYNVPDELIYEVVKDYRKLPKLPE